MGYRAFKVDLGTSIAHRADPVTEEVMKAVGQQPFAFGFGSQTRLIGFVLAVCLVLLLAIFRTLGVVKLRQQPPY